MRFTGIIAIPAFITSSGIESDISDFIKPGATAFTVILYFPTSLHNECVNPTIAALLAQ